MSYLSILYSECINVPKIHWPQNRSGHLWRWFPSRQVASRPSAVSQVPKCLKFDSLDTHLDRKNKPNIFTHNKRCLEDKDKGFSLKLYNKFKFHHTYILPGHCGHSVVPTRTIHFQENISSTKYFLAISLPGLEFVGKDTTWTYQVNRPKTVFEAQL